MIKGIYEIFEEIEKTPNRQDKINILRFNNRKALEVVLQNSFHPDIKFLIDRVPYYKPSDSIPGLGYNSIDMSMKRIYLFQANHPKRSPNLSQKKMENLLIEMLESLEAKEATVFVNMLLKKQKVKGLNYSLVKEAFPNLLP